MKVVQTAHTGAAEWCTQQNEAVKARRTKIKPDIEHLRVYDTHV